MANALPLLRFSAQQERVIDRFTKGRDGLDIASKKRNDDLIVSNASLVVGQRSIGSKGEADDIVVTIEYRNVVEKNN
jgi:hypothetical protein